MPRPPDPDAIAALIPYVMGELIAPSRLIWETRIAQRHTPEALLLQLQGWEPWQADTMPREEEGRPVLDQIIHFRKLVPDGDILALAKRWVDMLTDLPETEEP